ncbi:MBL fold metallo-hydrolase [Mucilaginibacter sp. CSA2-8R]|uniref:MBL fold metallo-hydrolase n=1 Tax=Mucilaginibacter sp. CSA2-8R TaxID=3141542 RepID=UPI00315C6F62
MKITPLDEGIYHVDQQKHYQLASHDDILPDQHMLRLSVRPFLVRTDAEVILLDTGLEANVDNGYLIESLLAQHGINAKEVTKVLLSHLHNDHVGGLGYFQNGIFKTHFNNADIYLQQRELTFALGQQNNPSYNISLLQQLSRLPNLKLLTVDSGNITPNITYQVVGGHTPYMQVFWLHDSNRIVFYGADDLPKKNYLYHHIAYKTDYDGRKAMQLRRQWEQQAKAEQWQVLLYHDTEEPFIQF